MLNIYTEKLLDLRAIRKLEDHKLSAVHVGCSNESAANLHA